MRCLKLDLYVKDDCRDCSYLDLNVQDEVVVQFVLEDPRQQKFFIHHLKGKSSITINIIIIESATDESVCPSSVGLS